MSNTREAVAIVAALLREHGMRATLAALEKEAGSLMQEGDGTISDAADLALKLRALKLGSKVAPAHSDLGESDPLMAPYGGKLAVVLEQTVSSAHPANVLCVAFCGASREFLASGGADKLIALTSATSGEVEHRLSDHTAPVLAVAPQPDGGTLLASAAMDGRVLLHDVNTHELVGEWTAHKKYALCASWRDRETFATCSSDGTVAAFRAGGEAGSSFVKAFDLPLSREHGVT
ncbi:WD40-repeat-containing domain protein, partial [Pavlovales sp. CCMP2436]